MKSLFFSVAFFGWSAADIGYFFSASQGYTHYAPTELNRVMELMQKTLADAGGLKTYSVDRFEGRPANAVHLGMVWQMWRLELSAGYWREIFRQRDVPFSLDGNAVGENGDCEQLRNSPRAGQSMAGCLSLDQYFTFVPITVQLSRRKALTERFHAGAGFGLGIMGGAADLVMGAQYFGQGAAPDDRIRFRLHPGVHVVNQVFADLEYALFARVGIALRGGWRYSRLDGFKVAGLRGSSSVFDQVFPFAKDGAELYVVGFGSGPESDQVFLGSREDLETRIFPSRYEPVKADFSGWFLNFSLVFHWSPK